LHYQVRAIRAVAVRCRSIRPARSGLEEEITSSAARERSRSFPVRGGERADGPGMVGDRCEDAGRVVEDGSPGSGHHGRRCRGAGGSDAAASCSASRRRVERKLPAIPGRPSVTPWARCRGTNRPAMLWAPAPSPGPAGLGFLRADRPAQGFEGGSAVGGRGRLHCHRRLPRHARLYPCVCSTHHEGVAQGGRRLHEHRGWMAGLYGFGHAFTRPHIPITKHSAGSNTAMCTTDIAAWSRLRACANECMADRLGVHHRGRVDRGCPPCLAGRK